MVEVDKGQMSQVINNLIINADQAMPEGGVIEVNASNINIREDNILPIDPGNYVEISIKDEGVGIPEEQLLNIYDPFFSTKDGGSGLGLTTAYSIIQRHEGYISVESELGVGSIFYIYLPAVKEKEKIEEEKSGFKPFKKGAKILLMDDEEVIRDVAGRMLKRLGYKVEFASNGVEVVDKYKKAYESGDGFDAVIMDLTIPGGMGGRDAIIELLNIDPDVKAIVSSGYFNDPVMANFKDYGFSGVVPKPYNTEELDNVLKRVFENK
jgi:two-component system cell cycle sensor histidine kinase/response regulator CckA